MTLTEDDALPAETAAKAPRKARRAGDVGSITKIGTDGKKWRLRCYVGKIGGKRVDRDEVFHGTAKEARTRLDEIRKEKGRPELKRASRITLGEWISTYFETWSGHLRPKTRESYKRLMENYLPPTLVSRPLAELSREDVQNWLIDLSTKPTKPAAMRKDGRVLSRRSVEYCRSTLRLILNGAVEQGRVATNAVKGTKLPTREAAVAVDHDSPVEARGDIESRAFSEEEIGAFLNAAARRTARLDGVAFGGTRDHVAPYWQLALETGMRPSELLGLLWRDVLLEKSPDGKTEPFVRVNHALNHVSRAEPYDPAKRLRKGNGRKGARDGDEGDAPAADSVAPKRDWWVLLPPKTAKSKRTIPISDDSVQQLRQHRLRQDADKRAARGSYRDMGFVFATAEGTPIDLNNLRKQSFQPLLDDSGIAASRKANGIVAGRLYDLRHSLISHLLRDGVSVVAVAERAGHAKASMTLDRYAHALDGQQEAATGVISARLNAARKAAEAKVDAETDGITGTEGQAVSNPDRFASWGDIVDKEFPCATCARRNRQAYLPVTCEAFPEGVPSVILRGDEQHRTPVEGDRGLQWAPKP